MRPPEVVQEGRPIDLEQGHTLPNQIPHTAHTQRQTPPYEMHAPHSLQEGVSPLSLSLSPVWCVPL